MAYLSLLTCKKISKEVFSKSFLACSFIYKSKQDIYIYIYTILLNIIDLF